VAVSTPQDDYLPNIDPATTAAGTTDVSGDPTLAPGSANSAKYPALANSPPPQPVRNLRRAIAAGANFGREDTAAIEGRININTAHWKVLSAVPFYSPAADSQFLADNAALAQDITGTRDAVDEKGHSIGVGPFRSLFDLMKVPQFNEANGWWVNRHGGAGEMTAADGNLSRLVGALPDLGAARPPSPGECDATDHVFGDVRSRFALLQRVSNLITVRSDSFTAYSLVQGWQDAGTTPHLVATRRTASLLDRSQVKPVRNAATNSVTVTPIGVSRVPSY
jgi:hypothetical protein